MSDKITTQLDGDRAPYHAVARHRDGGLSMSVNAAWAECNSYRHAVTTLQKRASLRRIRIELQSALGLVEQELADLRAAEDAEL